MGVEDRALVEERRAEPQFLAPLALVVADAILDVVERDERMVGAVVGLRLEQVVVGRVGRGGGSGGCRRAPRRPYRRARCRATAPRRPAAGCPCRSGCRPSGGPPAAGGNIRKVEVLVSCQLFLSRGRGLASSRAFAASNCKVTKLFRTDQVCEPQKAELLFSFFLLQKVDFGLFSWHFASFCPRFSVAMVFVRA